MIFPPSTAPVEALFRDYHSIRGAIGDANVSDSVSLDSHFRKLLILASASHLETLMTFHLDDHFQSIGEANHEFVRRFALDRKFYQWFDFDARLPSKFFKSFGSACEQRYKDCLEDTHFEESSLRFLEICRSRNSMIHANLAEYSFEMTPQEIEKNFRLAREFPERAVRIIQAT